MTNTAKKHPEGSASIEYGKEILLEGAHAIARIASSLDETFAEAVEFLATLPPNARIVVSGMGKAGFAAMKLSATLASIGFPSFFLHPADAIHGDLGRLTRQDVVILLSKSGETSELLRLLPTIKEFGATIISVTSSAESTLAKHSEIVIPLGDIREAGPLGLAPTTSTTVMVAVGDALAMTLVQRRGFTREEFARFHPGGSLGRALMLVREIMRSDDAHCVVPATMLVKDVLHSITCTRGRPGAAAIVDGSGVLIGVFTDGNLRRCLEKDIQFLEKQICDVCSHNPKTVSADQLAREAARLMREFEIDQLIVVDGEKRPIGLVDVQDLLAHGMFDVRG